MKNIITFIIPVRHQENAKNWQLLKKNLTQTIHSISQQDGDAWKAVIVANYGADLPALPTRFEIKWVDFHPNPMHDQGQGDRESFHEAFRIDKGRRVLAGMLHASEMGHVMVVDDDDFVSRKILPFVSRHSERNGWYIRDGYVWGEDDHFVYKRNDFSTICGTSHIIRADLYQLPDTIDSATDQYIRSMLGSHLFIHQHLDASGTPLEALPFPGAVYRVGHAGAHSQSSGVLREYFYKKSLLKRPDKFCQHVLRLRPLTAALRSEFSVG